GYLPPGPCFGKRRIRSGIIGRAIVKRERTTACGLSLLGGERTLSTLNGSCVVHRSKSGLLMSESGQNENPPRWGLCQLPPATDISCLTQAVNGAGRAA